MLKMYVCMLDFLAFTAVSYCSVCLILELLLHRFMLNIGLLEFVLLIVTGTDMKLNHACI